MAKANVTTDPEALREAIRVLGNMPVGMNRATLSFQGDTFLFARDSDDAWYLSEVW